MSVRKLSEEIQSLICSSYNINNYKRSVEELVYNSLDAKSTSIAIRIHIQENKIQVVDNGCGIAKKDFELLGQRYATSKYVDLLKFKSAPDTYGYRGQMLSSIIEVSENVKMTSRSENSEKTWSKSFYGGKEQNITKVATRPSKGTTVDISGFLYKLKIQNKVINVLQEINGIKAFLERISLVHSNISLTLRDDSTNEIVFKMHKNRDIYQKLKILFNVDKGELQVLQVEKNEYKCLAYVGKKCDEMISHHWIFLNNKYVKKSKLNKLVEQFFTNYLKLSCKVKKFKSKYSDQNDAPLKYVPFYIIFLSCPYYDYDISYTPKQSVLEFKDWKQVNKLLEKLIKFYMGEIHLKESRLRKEINTIQEPDIREKVREITEKYLRCNSKKIGISQMQNGIKGKVIKRKKKKQKHLPILEVMKTSPSMNFEKSFDKLNNVAINKTILEKFTPIKTKKAKFKMPNKGNNAASFLKLQKANNTFKRNNNQKNKSIKSATLIPKETSKLENETKAKDKKAMKRKRDPLINVFDKLPATVKRRCENLAKEAANILVDKTTKQTIIVNETVDYGNIIKDNKNISYQRRVGEIIIHDIIPIQRRNKKPQTIHRKDSFKSSHDLLKTILDNEEVKCYSPNEINNKHQKNEVYLTFKGHREIPQLTYQSHCYDDVNNTVDNHCLNRNKDFTEQFVIEEIPSPISVSLNHNLGHENTRFISRQSRDNFSIPNTKTLKLHKNKMSTFGKTQFELSNINNSHEDDMIPMDDPDATINTNVLFYSAKKFNNLTSNDTMHSENVLLNTEKQNEKEDFDRNSLQCDEMRHSIISSNFGFTYTITSSNIVKNVDDKALKNYECATDFRTLNLPFNFVSNKNDTLKQNNELIDHVSNSHYSKKEEYCNSDFEPINVCEAIINSLNTVNEIELIFNNNASLHDVSPADNYQNYDLYQPDNVSNFDNNISLLAPHQLPSNNNVLNDIYVNTKEDTNCEKEKSTNNEEISTKINDGKNIENNEINNFDLNTESYHFNEQNREKDNSFYNTNIFNLRNRFRFIPKGLSPIFEYCNSKNTSNYKFDKEYFAHTIYDNFKSDVKTNSEVYQARIQNTKDDIAKDIDKIYFRLEKDHSTLTFSTKSLQEATVLKQVDNKFIACVMKGNRDLTNYLVLFDQHAVHERIRLERNLSDYFDGNEWKNVILDEFSLKMSKDEIMYLHNYKEKFYQFGLKWNIVSDNEIKVYSIPLAILGKNPREVDKVITTAKFLILEEIKNIVSQKGCVSLYPKSIMNLVNNEACRYAIMFGDLLSNKECVDLLKSLATCKTPFQCAHGRPVMAIIMEFKPEVYKYQINLKNLLQFKSNVNTK